MTCTEAVALITGGWLANDHRSVEVYSNNIQCNQLLPDLPEERLDHTLDYVDGRILLCGGYNTGKSCLEMNNNTFSWNNHSYLSEGRYYFDSIVSGGQLLLVGGIGSPYTTESSTPRISSNWTNGFDLVEGTEDHCVVKISQQQFIVTGGYYYGRHVVKYDISDGSSTCLLYTSDAADE